MDSDADAAGEKPVNGDKDAVAEEAEEVDEEEEEREVYYDKSKSFFDNISCESTARGQG